MKCIIVRLHSAQKGIPDYTKSFIYALMPKTDQMVKFKVLDPALSQFHFSASGYASGDTYFSTRSPTMKIKTKDTENNVLLT